VKNMTPRTSLLIALGVAIITTSCGTTRTLFVHGEPGPNSRNLGSDQQRIVGYRTLDDQQHEFIGLVEPMGDSLRFERRFVEDRGIMGTTRGEVRILPRDSVVSVEGAAVNARPLFIVLITAAFLSAILVYAAAISLAGNQH